MKFEDVREEIEREITWRRNEMRTFKNQLSNILKEEKKRSYRKALIVMLYSHYEGFTKNCFLIVINKINELKCDRKKVKPCIAAASMHKIFKAYENKERKSDIFRRNFPDDKSIHRFFRRADLVIQFEDFMNEKVKIPDEVVNTEFNLYYEVLQKILYRLGFDYKSFKKYKSDINKLVNLRNNIAHGSQTMGFDEKFYNKLEKSTFKIINGLLKLVMEFLNNGEYLK